MFFSAQEYTMVPPADNPARLSVHWAFVLQFQVDTAVEQGHLAGRVEHVVSGQAANFQSLDTLLAFIAQVLHEERRRADHHHV
jgi:hypothetical protein